mmetsp:Transcript_28691/g.98760  ORF Transcript_28691/g.98760 Transcript_28691/m.98760 type:complete len:457 (+) Transcript_28691:246-1616(+)
MGGRLERPRSLLFCLRGLVVVNRVEPLARFDVRPGPRGDDPARRVRVADLDVAGLADHVLDEDEALVQELGRHGVERAAQREAEGRVVAHELLAFARERVVDDERGFFERGHAAVQVEKVVEREHGRDVRRDAGGDVAEPELRRVEVGALEDAVVEHVHRAAQERLEERHEDGLALHGVDAQAVDELLRRVDDAVEDERRRLDQGQQARLVERGGARRRDAAAHVQRELGLRPRCGVVEHVAQLGGRVRQPQRPGDARHLVGDADAEAPGQRVGVDARHHERRLGEHPEQRQRLEGHAVEERLHGAKAPVRRRRRAAARPLARRGGLVAVLVEEVEREGTRRRVRRERGRRSALGPRRRHVVIALEPVRLRRRRRASRGEARVQRRRHGSGAAAPEHDVSKAVVPHQLGAHRRHVIALVRPKRDEAPARPPARRRVKGAKACDARVQRDAERGEGP